MSVKEMNLSWITVKDLKKAIEYYTSIGLKVDEISEEWGWAELSGEDGGARLGLGQEAPDSPFKAGHNAIVTMTVDNLDEKLAELKTKGVELAGEIVEVPGHVRMQLCVDPDGNQFHVVEMCD